MKLFPLVHKTSPQSPVQLEGLLLGLVLASAGITSYAIVTTVPVGSVHFGPSASVFGHGTGAGNSAWWGNLPGVRVELPRSVSGARSPTAEDVPSGLPPASITPVPELTTAVVAGSFAFLGVLVLARSRRARSFSPPESPPDGERP